MTKAFEEVLREVSKLPEAEQAALYQAGKLPRGEGAVVAGKADRRGHSRTGRLAGFPFHLKRGTLIPSVPGPCLANPSISPIFIPGNRRRSEGDHTWHRS